MATNELNNAIFQDADKARSWLEARLWPEGPVCGYCGVLNNATQMKSRPGYYQCNSKGCRKQFTVQVGTVFERSHIVLNKWLMAAFLMCASKKGVSAHQMHRMLGVTYKSAWFMMHRLREAMRDGFNDPLGGAGKVVEVDETYVGRREGVPKATRGGHHKNIVMTLVERGGSARSFHIDAANSYEIRDILVRNASRQSALMTDEARWYITPGAEFASHETVNHSIDEYVRGTVTTNTVEGFYSIFKRGMRGVYQHCSEKHLHRYLVKFDFRYSNRAKLGINDVVRSEKLVDGIVGKRLTYRRAADRQADEETIPF